MRGKEGIVSAVIIALILASKVLGLTPQIKYARITGFDPDNGYVYYEVQTKPGGDVFGYQVGWKYRVKIKYRVTLSRTPFEYKKEGWRTANDTVALGPGAYCSYRIPINIPNKGIFEGSVYVELELYLDSKKFDSKQYHY